MLDALVLLSLFPASVYGLHCSQISVKTMSSGIGILTALNISFSGLNDHDLLDIPSCFRSPSEFASLQVLDLQGNQLSGQYLSTLLDRLPNLQYLYLQSNPLDELDGTLFRTARRLRFLDISETPLTTVPSDLLYPISASLLSLIMEKTHLKHIPADFFGRELEHGQWVLRNLSLSGNLLLSGLPDNIFRQLTSLKWIDVSETAIKCYPSSTSACLSKLPLSLPECPPRMRRRLLSVPETLATERAVFRLDQDYSSLTGQRRLSLINNLKTDISNSIGIKSSRIVNVQLGPTLPSTTVVQLDIIDDGVPTAEEAVSSMRNQSLIESSAFRTGSVTSHIVLSSSIVSIPAHVRKCSSASYVDVNELCPPMTQSSVFNSSSQIVVCLVIVMFLVAAMTVVWVIRATARRRSEKRLRDAMMDVINLSLEQEVLSPGPCYDAATTTTKPSIYPLLPITSFSDNERKSEAIETENGPKKPPLIKTPSTITLVKRPGLNAIRSKKMLLLGSMGDGDDSMLDTDAEF